MNKEDCVHIVRFINRIYSQSVIGEIHNWNLQVIDAVALLEKTGDANIRGLARQYGSEYTVFVLRQLSKVQFAYVLAHELLHIWQYNQNIYPIRPLCEGFCNLGSYIVLSKINVPEAKAARDSLLASTDKIYGDGFRLCKQLFEDGGWTRVIKELKNNPKE